MRTQRRRNGIQCHALLAWMQVGHGKLVETNNLYCSRPTGHGQTAHYVGIHVSRMKVPQLWQKWAICNTKGEEASATGTGMLLKCIWGPDSGKSLCIADRHSGTATCKKRG